MPDKNPVFFAAEPPQGKNAPSGGSKPEGHSVGVYFVSTADTPGYHPANHHGTLNRRLIGPETVGSRHLEVIHGTIEKGKGALPHAHPGIEQVCYVISGRAVAEVGGQRRELGPGDCCFFPPDAMHVFTVVSDEPAQILVIYSPPYEESPERVVRPA